MRFLIFSMLWLVSCTSFQVEQNLKLFNEAKKLSQTSPEEAQALWQLNCNKKHKASCLLVGQDPAWHPGLAIMQSSTDNSQTQLVVLKRKQEIHQFFIFDPKEKKVFEANKRWESSRDESQWSIVHLNFNNLSLNNDYIFLAVSEYGELVDFRRLRTLDKSKKKIKWALTSCMADYYEKAQKKQWIDLVSFNPDLIFMIGDNVYIDWGRKKNVDEKWIWKRHVETRNNLEIFRQARLTPILGTWDDHDYGKNNAGMNYPYKEESKKIFLKFFPRALNKVVVSNGPGVSLSAEVADQLFIFFDDRSFRTPKEAENIQSHFGEAQVKWAVEQIKKSKKPTWLISGDQFFGGYHSFESFQGDHPKDFKDFLNKMGKTGQRVLFLSGDRHLSEIMEIPKSFLGYKTYEITSSGIHSTTYPGAFNKSPNPFAKSFVDGVINYMIIDAETKGRGVKMTVKDFGPDKKLLFEKELSVQ